MKKTFISTFSSLVLCAGFVLVSCEGPAGPAGPAGADGEDGADGNLTCMECHASDVIETKQAEFALSNHSIGEVREGRESWSSSCVQCHIPGGFVQFAEMGEVLGTITNSERWECGTCHGLHKTFESDDYALRLEDPVVPMFDETMTMDLNGSSNLCANCHQTRRPEPNLDSPADSFSITSTHYGPHHGPQANVVYGAGFAEIAGSVAYPTAGSSNHLTQASCTGCHMGEESGATGGHTWWPNMANCNDCHNGTDLTEDFNYGGVQSDVQAKLDELRDKLVALGVVEYVEEDAAYEPVRGKYPMVQAQAFFNWIGLVEDRSLGAHNPKYVRALLVNTLEALD